jgi:N-acetyl-anhydromuramyl-L-alanine amidase AmpD
MKNLVKLSVLAAGTTLISTAVQASSDYGPAIWRPACSTHHYTTGSGHKFHVIHDIEGYYWTCISMFQGCGTSASVHYVTNGKVDNGSDSPAGEITQMVLDSQYAWHALCWNTHSTGTEHEGFVSNPAWFTDAQYSASAGITRNLSSKFGWAKDRNHVVGHNAKSSAAWVTYANANLGINATCNSHSDPGANWDWNKYMGMVNPVSGTIVDNTDAGFSVVGTSWATGTSATDKYGSNYRYHTVAPVSEPAQWTASVSAGAHTVYVWYPEGGNRSQTAPYIIQTAAGSSTVYVNQEITGGQWVNQGTFTMNAGVNYVKLSCWTSDTGELVMADAVKWQ